MNFSCGKTQKEKQIPDKGTYCLVLFLKTPRTIEIGRLGRVRFSGGYYVYVGSARGPGGLRARLGRHLRPEKPLRWHVDYLRRRARIHGIWTAPGTRNLEHRWAGSLMRAADASMPVPGFGASDCRCRTHLFHFSRPPEQTGVMDRLPGPARRMSRPFLSEAAL